MQDADRAPRAAATPARPGPAPQSIDLRTLGSISHHAAHPEEIGKRLTQLEREWDAQRALQTGASCLALLGLALARVRSPRWILLTAGVGGLLLQNAVHGRCAPLELLRRLGLRTPREVDDERFALKLLRGDFDMRSVAPGSSARVMEALRR